MVFRIDLKIFAFLIIFYFTKQIEIYAIIMVFAIIHELSHLLVGLLLNMKVKSITIMPMGLSIDFRLNIDKNLFLGEIKKIIVAIAGPMANILIIFITKTNNELVIYSNLFIAIFNLLPIYPLDGGRIIKSIIRLFANRKKTNIYVSAISNLTLFCVTLIFSILIYYLKNIALLFISIYLWDMVLRENRVNQQKKKLQNMVFTLSRI